MDIALDFQLAVALSSVRHSNFRAVCLLVYREDDKLVAEVGANSEVVSMAGSTNMHMCSRVVTSCIWESVGILRIFRLLNPGISR